MKNTNVILQFVADTEEPGSEFVIVMLSFIHSVKSVIDIREVIGIMDRSDEIIDAARKAQTASKEVMAVKDVVTTAASQVHSDAEKVDEALTEVRQKASEIATVKTEADTLAAQALEKASNAENEVADNQNKLDLLKENDDAMKLQIDGKVDGAYGENGYLYLTSNSEIVAGPLCPFSGTGGGGGSGGNNAVLTVTNTTGWISRTLAAGESCEISMNWSSVEDEMSTGKGTLMIVVNGSTRAMMNIVQGEIRADLSEYLSVGLNVVKVNVSDVYGNARTINFSITSIALSITSSFDASMPYTGPISFPFVPVGNVLKHVHFILDDEEIGSTETSVSGRQQSFTIPQQPHGAHTFRCYFESEINGQLVRSNELYFEIICLEVLNNTPVIISAFHSDQIQQYDTVHIAYAVYSPQSLFSDVTIRVNGTSMTEQTIDRSQQTFTYRADLAGPLTIEIQTGSVKKRLELTVKETDIHVEAEEEALVLFLSSYGRSNNGEKREHWKYKKISAQLTGFNFASDGWKEDEQGATVLRVSGDARIRIPYKPFENDFRTTGMTIELDFATHDVLNYDAVIMSCLSGGRGIAVTPQRVSFVSEQTVILNQYKEDEHVRISFVIEKRSENRLIYTYINGIMSGTVQYRTPGGNDPKTLGIDGKRKNTAKVSSFCSTQHGLQSTTNSVNRCFCEGVHLSILTGAKK